MKTKGFSLIGLNWLKGENNPDMFVGKPLCKFYIVRVYCVTYVPFVNI